MPSRMLSKLLKEVPYMNDFNDYPMKNPLIFQKRKIIKKQKHFKYTLFLILNKTENVFIIDEIAVRSLRKNEIEIGS
jgi:hypothetical protein